MNPPALHTMPEALGRISAIHRPTGVPVEQYDPEQLLEYHDFAVITPREALHLAAMPGESLN